jgi:hypothetical protein
MAVARRQVCRESDRVGTRTTSTVWSEVDIVARPGRVGFRPESGTAPQVDRWHMKGLWRKMRKGDDNDNGHVAAGEKG